MKIFEFRFAVSSCLHPFPESRKVFRRIPPPTQIKWETHHNFSFDSDHVGFLLDIPWIEDIKFDTRVPLLIGENDRLLMREARFD